MSFRRCQHDDPFTRRVRELYAANVVRAPRAGIEPLDVLAVDRRKVEQRGRLGGFLTGDVALPAAADHAVAEMDGLRSAQVELGLGLRLTASFLQALGVPVPGGELDATLWKGDSRLQFEVHDVRQRQVDVGELGRALAGATVDRASAATGVFFGERAIELCIITRTLTSPGFAVRTSSNDAHALTASVDAIADVIGKAHGNVTVGRRSADTVTFVGPEPVTFAFAAIPCAIQPDGRLLFGLERSGLKLGVEAAAEPPPRTIVDEDGLLDFDVLEV